MVKITCDNQGCTGEAFITVIRNVPPKVHIGPITVWTYVDVAGELRTDYTVLDAGPLKGKCPRCLEEEKK